jgi:WhiB family transcriptional regulator, redox-sensing transcriptional regulator
VVAVEARDLLAGLMVDPYRSPDDRSVLAELLQRPSWHRDALCRGSGLVFVPNAGSVEPAAFALCRRCPARRPCLEYALATPGTVGVWGGVTRSRRVRASGLTVDELIANVDAAEAVQ